MASCVPVDRERAVKEVAQVYERIKIQHPLLLLSYSSLPPSATAELAQSLLGEALRALNVALSVMKQPPAPAAAAAAAAGGGSVTVTPRRSIVKAELPELSPPSPASADSEATTARRSKKRSRSSVMMEGKNSSSSSWVNFTRVPYEDGYEWRKYGEKKINGTSFTRSYFRCTYKDDTGCMATKHIQHKDSNDPPMFQVTYNNKHTCNNCTTTTTAAANISDDRENGHAAAAMVKQEAPPLLLPPLVEASDALHFDQSPPYQQQQEPSLFHISTMQLQQFCGTVIDYSHDDIPSTSSSCISGESWGEYYYSAGDMAKMAAEKEASGCEDDPFFDFELLLLCDSFKDY